MQEKQNFYTTERSLVKICLWITSSKLFLENKKIPRYSFGNVVLKDSGAFAVKSDDLSVNQSVRH
ncbi:MAG TPA: hypothetical protein DEO40_01505 [Treponema sp.]|nr:hypothetical protein [Treponema sp.]